MLVKINKNKFDTFNHFCPHEIRSKILLSNRFEYLTHCDINNKYYYALAKDDTKTVCLRIDWFDGRKKKASNDRVSLL